MKTLGEIISLRKNKYKAHMKNPSFADFFQGYHAGWSEAYRDLEEILEQNGFNLNVPVIGVWKTNADRIRAMSDEELEDLFREVYNDGCDDATAWEWGIRQNTFIWDEEWLQQPAE